MNDQTKEVLANKLASLNKGVNSARINPAKMTAYKKNVGNTKILRDTKNYASIYTKHVICGDTGKPETVICGNRALRRALKSKKKGNK